MNRTKKDAVSRWKGLIVPILNSVSFVVLVMSAGNKTFPLSEPLDDYKRKPIPSTIPTSVPSS